MPYAIFLCLFFLNDKTRLISQMIPAMKNDIKAVCKKMRNITMRSYFSK